MFADIDNTDKGSAHDEHGHTESQSHIKQIVSVIAMGVCVHVHDLIRFNIVWCDVTSSVILCRVRQVKYYILL